MPCGVANKEGRPCQKNTGFNELRLLAEEMAHSGNAAQEKIKKEVLPQLRQETEKLREKLRELGREEEIKPLAVEFEKIQKI